MSKRTGRVSAGLVALFVVVMSSLGQGPVEIVGLCKPDLYQELFWFETCKFFIPGVGPVFF